MNTGKPDMFLFESSKNDKNRNLKNNTDCYIFDFIQFTETQETSVKNQKYQKKI